MCGPGHQCCSEPWGPWSTDISPCGRVPAEAESPRALAQHWCPSPAPETCASRGLLCQRAAKADLHWGLCSILQGLLAGAPGAPGGNIWYGPDDAAPSWNDFFKEGISSSTETTTATEFHRTKRLHQNTVMFPRAFLSFLHSERKSIGPASAIQLSTCCVSSCGSSCANTTGCLLSTAVDSHKQGSPW